MGLFLQRGWGEEGRGGPRTLASEFLVCTPLALHPQSPPPALVLASPSFPWVLLP